MFFLTQNKRTFSQKRIFVSSDDKDQRRSKKVLAELENIDDECDEKNIVFVKIDNEEEAKEYGIETIPSLLYFESEIPYIYEGKLSFCSAIISSLKV